MIVPNPVQYLTMFLKMHARPCLANCSFEAVMSKTSIHKFHHNPIIYKVYFKKKNIERVEWEDKYAKLKRGSA